MLSWLLIFKYRSLKKKFKYRGLEREEYNLKITIVPRTEQIKGLFCKLRGI